MINKVSRNYQFNEGDLIYVEDNPALVISVYLSGIKVLMLFDGKVKTKTIDRNRIEFIKASNEHLKVYSIMDSLRQIGEQKK